ncbi:hypothetical protein BGW39_003506 [Mortierella sp. 14UC]|nr:hypothetical protein BGW39_003506 [Mortierella sp. 14UC]
MTPPKMRMNRKALSTPRSQRYQQQDIYHQNDRGIYQSDEDAIAHGARRSAKDGSQYMQRTQQEDLTVESVEGLRTTQKAKRSLQQQGVITTSIEHPLMPYNTGTRNNGSPANRRRDEQNQEMGVPVYAKHKGTITAEAPTAVPNSSGSSASCASTRCRSSATLATPAV